VDAILNSFLALQRENRMSEAEAVLKAGVEQYGAEQRILVAYAEFLAIQRRHEESYAMFERALAAGPRTAMVEFSAGTVASILKRPERAAEHYAAAQAADPTDYRFPLFLAQVQLNGGVPGQGVDAARANLALAARLNPESAVVWGTLADIALRDNATGTALQHIARARELEPEHWLWRLIESRAHKRERAPEKGLELLAGLSEEDRFRPEIVREMAECLGLLGRGEEAAELYAEASDRRPDSGQLAFDAAVWNERVKRPSQAIRFAQRAANLGVEGAEALVKRLTGGEADGAGSGGEGAGGEGIK
jgi:tetratricopeptide (TPR) repeat protein